MFQQEPQTKPLDERFALAKLRYEEANRIRSLLKAKTGGRADQDLADVLPNLPLTLR